jgi:protein-tyrosine phosphatase
MYDQQAPLPSGGSLSDAIEERADMHCHCLPAIDDGPASVAEAIELCRLLVADGITTVVATPHQLGRYGQANTCRRILEGIEEFRRHLVAEGIPLQILPGAEVRIDEKIVQGVMSGDLLTLADGKFHVLLELPKHTFVDPMPLIREFAERHYRVIIAHPERQQGVMMQPSLAEPWFKSGAILQVTAGSLLGDFGKNSQRSAWELIGRGWVQLIASDAHDAQRRPPRISPAMDAISALFGERYARQLCVENPVRIAHGRDLPVPPRAPKPKHRIGNSPAPVSKLSAWAAGVEELGASSQSGNLSPIGSIRRWLKEKAS